MRLKQRIFSIIIPTGGSGSFWNKAFDFLIIFLIVASILEIILDSFVDFRIAHTNILSKFEVLTVMVFSVEYLLRIWTADLLYPKLPPWAARIKFITSFNGLIDLVAILPFYLPLLVHLDLRFVRVLRILRLLRVFKLNRYTRSLSLVAEVFYQKRGELGITIFITFLLLLVSSTLMYYLEGDVQPEQFPDIISTFWWAVATLTTVGYGDVYPVTGWGKLVSGVIALLGIGLVALPTGIVSSGFIEHIEQEREEKRSAYQFCPHCGEKLPH